MNETLIVVSYSHRNADVAFRDALALDQEQCLDLIQAALKSGNNIVELAPVSTCNRTEIYGLTADPAGFFPWVAEQISAMKGLDLVNSPVKPLILKQQEAVEHLMGVAGGIKSMMLGENQILAQVKESYRLIQSDSFKFPIFNRLFQDAIRAGKAVRTRTALCQGAVSISLAAVELSRKIFSSFTKRNVLLLGAGETNALVAVHYRELGVTNFTIANRNEERRRDLAERFSAKSLPIDDLPEALVEADIVVAATKSTEFLVTRTMIEKIMKIRHYRSLLIIDISSPRNVEPAVGDLSEAYLYNIDDLSEVVAENLEKRKKEIPAAEEIIRSIAGEFRTWLKTLEVVPTISRLHAYFNSVRDQELNKYLHKTSTENFSQLDELSRSLVRKLLHYPISSLRKQSTNGYNDVTKINAIWDIFRLKDVDEEEK